MATYGYTSGDQIPYPSNPDDAADVIAWASLNANAVQAGLTKKALSSRNVIAGAGLGGGGSLTGDVTLNVVSDGSLTINADSMGVNWGSLNNVYAAAGHTHSYAAVSHTHNPSQVGIRAERISIGNLAAGKEMQFTRGMLSGEIATCTVQHSSSWITAVIAGHAAGTSISIEVRNTTSSTDHTGIYVHIHYIRAN